MVWPGYAVLHLLGFGSRRWASATLAAPAVTLALFVVVMSGTAWASIAFSTIAFPVWIGILVLMIAGIALRLSVGRLAEGNHRGSRFQFFFWLIAVLIPFAIMPSIFQFGLATFANSTYADGWSYIAFSDYLMHAPRGFEGGLSPLDQYASHMMQLRNASSSIIAYISILLRVRPDEVMSLYCMLVIFANATALVAFARSTLSRYLQTVFLVLAGLVPAIVVYFANFDQMLLLPFLPLIATFAIRSEDASLRSGVVLGILIAASWLAYVELAPLAALVALSPLFSGKPKLTNIAILCVASALVALLLAYPGASPLLGMLKSQYIASQAAVRPGEGYFWGWRLGIGTTIVLALIIASTAVYGAWIERRRWGLFVALAVVLALSAQQAFYARYAYGLYKLLTVNSWLLCFLLVVAVDRIAAAWSPLVLQRYRIVTLVLLSILAIAIVRTVDIELAPNGEQQKSYRQASDIAKIIAEQPTLISVREPIANEWAIFYLSSVPAIINPYRLYMAQAHVLPYMARARPVDSADIAYIVTDRDDVVRSSISGAKRIWNGDVYSLWKTDRCSWQLVETAGAQPFGPACPGNR